ncbi:hypothetical protein Agub_g8462, partial [Astrephomene gubernaculifera]
FSVAELAGFLAAAEAAEADEAMMEVAWEIALDGGRALQLRELASLLFDDTSPRALFVTHHLLARDDTYFKQATSRAPSGSGAIPVYSPRPAPEVAELRRRAEQQAAAQREAEAWRAAVSAARAGSSGARGSGSRPSAAEWLAGPFAARIAALQAVALSSPQGGDSSSSLAAASSAASFS